MGRYQWDRPLRCLVLDEFDVYTANQLPKTSLCKYSLLLETLRAGSGPSSLRLKL
jgi:hypothetical protein